MNDYPHDDIALGMSASISNYIYKYISKFTTHTPTHNPSNLNISEILNSDNFTEHDITLLVHPDIKHTLLLDEISCVIAPIITSKFDANFAILVDDKCTISEASKSGTFRYTAKLHLYTFLKAVEESCDFSTALRALRAGKTIRRLAWFNDSDSLHLIPRKNIDLFVYEEHIEIHSSALPPLTCVDKWCPTIKDILATDWVIL